MHYFVSGLLGLSVYMLKSPEMTMQSNIIKVLGCNSLNSNPGFSITKRVRDTDLKMTATYLKD